MHQRFKNSDLKTRIMGKYSKAVSGMYSQFKRKEARPMEKYVGRLAKCGPDEVLEVVGYKATPAGALLIVLTM